MTDIILKSNPMRVKRHAAERRFKAYGIIAITLSLAFLFVMVVSIGKRGMPAFSQGQISLTIDLAASVIDPDGTGDPDVLRRADYRKLTTAALYKLFPEVVKRRDRKQLKKLISSGAGFEIANKVLKNSALVGTTQTIWLPLASDADLYLKGQIKQTTPQNLRRLSDKQLVWLDRLVDEGKIRSAFNWTFLTGGDSRSPELAGILGATMGSLLSLAVCFALAFPIGVLAAIYLEEFAPKNRINTLIEININNLAAVPSIVFGLLGLAILLGTFGLPRSSPLVGGLVLALMTLPTIIIASRAALRAVPPSIREAALGIGASKVQTTFHHVTPLAMPGMLTGAIVGMAQALGETAPLLMIGMVAFIADVPQSFTNAATALPVQIFLWADSPERGFLEKTSAAIIVLIGFLILMNLLAIILRKKLERRW